MRAAYLKPSVAARLMRVSLSTMRRRIQDGLVPALLLTRNIHLVEARHLVPNAPSADDPPVKMGARELGAWLNLHPTTILYLARHGVIPGVLEGGRLVVYRRPLLRMVNDLTIGDGD